jgi:hypothetical protein
MGAIVPSPVVVDTVYGQQFRHGGQILVLPFTTSGAASDSWSAPKGMNPITVAWQANTVADYVGVGLNTLTKTVTFMTDAGPARSGNLILICGGKS